MPRRTQWRGPLAVGVLAVVLQLPVHDRWVSFMDEGHILAFADVVAQGGELYRDATLYPLPGAFHLLAEVFRVFGASVVVARRVVVVEFAILVVLVLLLLRRLLPSPLVAVGVGLLFIYRVWAFPHWQMYSYSTTALCLLTGALVALARYHETRAAWRLALVGGLGGLGILCKQDYGVAVLGALAVVVGLEAWTGRGRVARRLVVLAAPPLVLGALVAAHYWRLGLLGEVLRQTVWGHLQGLATFEYPSLPPLLPLFAQDPALRGTYGHVVWVPPIIYTVDWAGARASWLYRETAVWDTALKAFFYGPFLLVPASIVLLVRRRAALGDATRRIRYLHELALVAFAAAALVVVALNKPRDYVHLAVLYWPFLALLLLAVRAVARGGRWRAVAVALPALTVGIPFTTYTAQLGWWIRSEHPVPLVSARGGVHVRAAEAAVLDEVVAYMDTRTTPEEPVAVLPYFPLVSFLAERRAPHRSAWVVWPVPDHPDRDLQIADALEATATDTVVYSVTQWPQFPRMEEYARPLFDHLVDHFVVDRVFSPDPWGYVLLGLRRGGEDTGGERLPLASGTMHVTEPDGSTRVVTGPERAGYLGTRRWPFRPVVTQRPVAGGGRSMLEMVVPVPDGAHLRTAVGVNPAAWIGYPALAVDFAVTLDGETIFTRRLDPQRLVADRGWVEVDLPLARWAGQTIRLGLVVACERPEAERLDFAGWATPRIMVAGSTP